jgi:Synapsin, ATP binding domain
MILVSTHILMASKFSKIRDQTDSPNRLLFDSQDKPWVFAHLLQLQRRLGKDAFPLIDQQFFISPREMVSKISCF